MSRDDCYSISNNTKNNCRQDAGEAEAKAKRREEVGVQRRRKAMTNKHILDVIFGIEFYFILVLISGMNRSVSVQQIIRSKTSVPFRSKIR